MGEKYSDQQRAPSVGHEQYAGQFRPNRNPEGVKVFPGYGANAADLERGYCEMEQDTAPKHELGNYKDRWTQPRVSDEDSDGGINLPDDIQFRQESRQSKGLFMRPRIPTER